MKTHSIKIVFTLMLTLGITMGAVACTSNSDDSGDINVESSQTTPEKAVGSTVNSIRDLSLRYMDMSEEELASSETELSSYFDPAVDVEKREEVIGVFAQILEMDPEATIEIDANKIQTEGDTAKLNGKDIRITINGEIQKASEEGGVITLKLQDNKWVISDIETPNSESVAPESFDATEEELDEFEDDFNVNE
jgi:hypothetical protein